MRRLTLCPIKTLHVTSANQNYYVPRQSGGENNLITDYDIVLGRDHVLFAPATNRVISLSLHPKQLLGAPTASTNAVIITRLEAYPHGREAQHERLLHAGVVSGIQQQPYAAIFQRLQQILHEACRAPTKRGGGGGGAGDQRVVKTERKKNAFPYRGLKPRPSVNWDDVDITIIVYNTYYYR